MRFLVLACLLFWSACAEATAAPGRKLALLVGVEKYDKTHFSQLRYCCDDVRTLAGLLKSQGFTCRLLADEGYVASGVKVPSPRSGTVDIHGLPTRAAVTRELTALLKGAGTDDLILVVLSGHGLQPPGASQPFFCPLDANPEMTFDTVRRGQEVRVVHKLKQPETMLGIGDLLGQLERSDVGHSFMLIDACRDAPAAKGAKSLGPTTVPIGLLPENCSVLMSCSRNEQSFEDSRFGPNGRGAFLDAVIVGLEGAAANAKGEVTWGGLANFVPDRVKSSMDEVFAGKQTQTPNEIKNSSSNPVLVKVATRRPTTTVNSKPTKAAPKAPKAAELSPEAKRWEALLNQKVEVDFLDLPLREAILSLIEQVRYQGGPGKAASGVDVNLEFDEKAIDDDGTVSLDDPVSLTLSGVSLRLAMTRLLKPRGLGWYIEENVLTVTTQVELDVRGE